MTAVLSRASRSLTLGLDSHEMEGLMAVSMSYESKYSSFLVHSQLLTSDCFQTAGEAAVRGDSGLSQGREQQGRAARARGRLHHPQGRICCRPSLDQKFLLIYYQGYDLFTDENIKAKVGSERNRKNMKNHDTKIFEDTQNQNLSLLPHLICYLVVCDPRMHIENKVKEDKTFTNSVEILNLFLFFKD